MEIREQLAQWMKPLTRFGAYGVIEESLDGRLSVLLYTPKHRYSISFHAGGDNGHRSYLGCIMINRDGGGEGRDLADGPFSYETWVAILSDIVAMEMTTSPETDAVLIRFPTR